MMPHWKDPMVTEVVNAIFENRPYSALTTKETYNYLPLPSEQEVQALRATCSIDWKAMHKAMEDGEAAAERDTKPGAKFLGAWPAAEAAGYAARPYRSAFTMAYLAKVPALGVRIAQDGTVL
jgi:hypothetical protein